MQIYNFYVHKQVKSRTMLGFKFYVDCMSILNDLVREIAKLLS